MGTNPRDLNNNYEDEPQNASYKMARNIVENMPKLTEEKISDIDNTRTKEDELFMEICGNEDWMQRYEDIVWPPEEVTMVTTGGTK